MPYLNHNLPTFTCLFRDEYLYNHTKGHGDYTLCDVHTVTSIEKRVPLFEVYLNNGVNWTRRPITALCWKECEPDPLEETMYWDCFSSYIDVNIRQRLSGLRGLLINPSGKKKWGTYMFTLDWGFENKSILDTNFSEHPEHKCAHFFKMDHGNFWAYPNNRIIWHDDAWVEKPIEGNPGYQIDQHIYSVENRRLKYTDNSYMTEFSDIRYSDDENRSDNIQ